MYRKCPLPGTLLALPMMSIAAPCHPAPDAPNGFRAVVVEKNTLATVVSDDALLKLAQPRPVRCVVMLLSTGVIIAEDRERMGGWHSCVIWSPEGIYRDEVDDQRAPTLGP